MDLYSEIMTASTARSVFNGWSDQLRSQYNAAVAGMGAAIDANPSAYRRSFESAMRLMVQTRRDLSALAVKLQALPSTDPRRRQLKKLREEHSKLSAGIMMNTSAPVGGEIPIEIGAVPVFVVLGLAFSVAAVAWAVACYPLFDGIRVEAQALLADVESRADASRDGRTIQPSSLPTGAASNASPDPTGALLLGGAALLGAGLIAALWASAAGGGDA